MVGLKFEVTFLKVTAELCGRVIVLFVKIEMCI